MKKLIRQDISNFLCLIGECYPHLMTESYVESIRSLVYNDKTDYLLLVKPSKIYLFPIAQVFTPGSYASLCWTDISSGKAGAFYLHIADTSVGPSGTVVMLDYTETVMYIEQAVGYSHNKRSCFMRQLMEHWRKHSQICTVTEMILSMEGEHNWTLAAKSLT